ncbi:MAG: OsmC family protein [Candidatus Hodarchaeales archaeon]|jgi:uncharacterized OsmC-like protein
MRIKKLVEKMHFITTATWDKDKEGSFLTTDYTKPILFSCPPKLGGIETPSPEDLFLSAIATCTLTTLLHICDSLRITPNTLEVSVSGDLRLIEASSYEFENIKCRLVVTGDKFLLERACEKVPKLCVVSNSIKSLITYEVIINSQHCLTLTNHVGT